MKKNIGKILLILIFIMTYGLALAACRSKTTSSVTNQKPIEVVSVQGPMPPMNYGVPNVETLKNVANDPVVSLTAFFTNLFSSDYDFSFNVGTSNPLLPGASVNCTQVLMSGFSNDA